MCLFCLISLFAVSCASRPVATGPDDPLFGTWVSAQYDRPGSSWFAKKVIFPNGRELDFDHLSDTEPAAESRNSIGKAWIDAESNHWYRIHIRLFTSQGSQIERFALCRVNAQGTILEQLLGRFDYPDEMTSADVNYAVYRRLDSSM